MRISSSIPVVMGPISACCGSSFGPPGSPRSVTMRRMGSSKMAFSEVSGLTALPSPEFWNIATARWPPSCAPVAMATASPSFVAGT